MKCHSLNRSELKYTLNYLRQSYRWVFFQQTLGSLFEFGFQLLTMATPRGQIKIKRKVKCLRSKRNADTGTNTYHGA